MDYEPYNPLDERNLGASVAEALLERDPVRMGNLKRFPGAGIYAIYYIGDFPAYAAMAERNRDGLFQWPVYVGKAVASGARKGKTTTENKVEFNLYDRLKEHLKSIEEAQNLNADDFYCRALVVKEIWIPLGESLLINKFAPVWNRLLDGFGNHNPGKGRYDGMISRWDVLHPGRKWAPKFQPRSETAAQLAGEVAAFLASSSVPKHPRFLGV